MCGIVETIVTTYFLYSNGNSLSGINKVWEIVLLVRNECNLAEKCQLFYFNRVFNRTSSISVSFC